ncbi:MAG TPA: (2Fe-2S) ferredoxin domain-containing protein, partial [Armatimonadota bacterium]|nr:(2Fe-2S) ferredoxin domain-containing protein [Armatimonadota bacterium]
MSCPSIELNVVAEEYRQAAAGQHRRIIVCAGTGCVANGSLRVRDAFVAQLPEAGWSAITVPSPASEDEADRRVLVSGSG